MTSQVVLLNRTGVAIASDSIATLSSEGTAKPLSNEKKVFEVGENHKVLVLNQGNTMISGVPVETLLAKWALGLTEPMSNTFGYLENFLDFLETLEVSQIPEMQQIYQTFVYAQLRTISDSVASYFDGDRPWWEPVQARFTEDATFLEEYSRRVSLEVGKYSRILASLRELKLVDEDLNQSELLSKAAQMGNLDLAVDLWFPPQVCTKYTRERLVRLMKEAVAKVPLDVESDNLCHLAFVGYGSEDIFPSIHSLAIESVYYGICRWTGVRQASPYDSTKGIIYLMAQHKSIDAFLNGFHSSFLDNLKEVMPNAMLDEQNLNSDNPGKLRRKEQEMWKGFGANIFERLNFNFQVYKQRHREEFEHTVGHLGITELSKVAKSLLDIEILGTLNEANTATVGGAVAVANITLARGIEWENRV